MDPKHLDILNVMDLFFNKLDDDFVDNVASRFNKVQLDAQTNNGRHAYPSEFMEKMERTPHSQFSMED